MARAASLYVGCPSNPISSFRTNFRSSSTFGYDAWYIIRRNVLFLDLNAHIFCPINTLVSFASDSRLLCTTSLLSSNSSRSFSIMCAGALLIVPMSISDRMSSGTEVLIYVRNATSNFSFIVALNLAICCVSCMTYSSSAMAHASFSAVNHSLLFSS